MQAMAISLAIVGLAAALIAAKYWYASSQGKVPIFYITPAGTYESEIENLIRQSASLNRRAAIWTAIAVVLGAVSAVAGSLIS
jgi:hypothetical protein